jgi:acetyltransferase-like isoleucine patch superfamily enzyme
MGAVVRQQQQVGSGSVLGAGAVLVSDLPDNALAYGVPARLIEKADNGD